MSIWTLLSPRLRVCALVCALQLWVADGSAGQSRPTHAPPPEVTVRVRQVAGSNVYLEMGTAHGLARGDTITAIRGGEPVGSLVVTAATERRSVLSFAGAAFPVSGGDPLTLRLLREPAESLSREADAGSPHSGSPGASRRPGEGTSPEGAPVETASRSGTRGLAVQARGARGRLALDLSAVHSSTRFGAPDPVEIGRTFATPSLAVDATIPDAIGGFHFRTSLRTTYRYSDRDIVAPAAAVRVRTATLEKAFTTAPVQLALGRFHSPVESYSGYWDGVMVRVGGDRVGVGALVGFQPERWDERPSTDLPKATAFVDARADGQDWRWQGDLSGHTVRPTSGAPDHTFFGLSQRFSVGRLLLSQDLQVDRDPAGSGWRVSDFRLRSVVGLSATLDLRMGVARRESYLFWREEDFFGARSERVSGGIGYRARSAYLGLDLSANRTGDGDFDSRTWTGSFTSPSLPGLPGIGLAGSVSRWDGPPGDVWSAAPSLLFSVRRTRLRAGYRMRRSDFYGRDELTHGLDLSMDTTLGEGLRASVRVGGERGATLRSESLRITLYRIF